jgi:hypothetical protein
MATSRAQARLRKAGSRQPKRKLKATGNKLTKAPSSLRSQMTTRAPSTALRKSGSPQPTGNKPMKAPSSLRSQTTTREPSTTRAIKSEAKKIIIEKKSGAKKIRLKPWQEKHLLKHIEETDKPILDFDLLKACNLDSKNFGLSGTELRRLIQYKFKYLKKLPIDKYVRYLSKYGQNPSATTQRLLLEATTPSATTQRLLLEATTSQGSGMRVVKKFGKTGMRIAKKFGKKVHFGTVVQFKTPFWNVRYDDDDEEDFNDAEIVKHAKLFETFRPDVEVTEVLKDDDTDTEDDDVIARIIRPLDSERGNTNSQPATERIKKITQLHKLGMVTKEEFDKKKQEIIDSI